MSIAKRTRIKKKEERDKRSKLLLWSAEIGFVDILQLFYVGNAA
jgi:hypothetical protein